jgi:hypothetical protein
MHSRIGASIVAGVIAGIVFGIMMHVMTAPTPDGGRMPVIAMVGQIVGSASVQVGWLYHLFNSAVIGGLFGWLLAPRVAGYASGLAWGAAYGFAWWISAVWCSCPYCLGCRLLHPSRCLECRWSRWAASLGTSSTG